MLNPHSLFRRSLGALLMCSALLLAAADSDFVTGTLDNGLSYIVAYCPIETDVAQMHLRLSVGGIDEAEEERGYSHFLEHMAFEGSTQFPHGVFENPLHSPLNRMGIQSNAYTSLSETVYTLYIDEPRSRKIKTGLSFFADIFDGLEFNAERVEHERAVILEEKREGETSDERFYSRVVDEAIFGHHLFGRRQVIGTEDTLLTASADSLRTYHAELYCPSKATVLVVGDIDPESVVRRIEDQLSELAPRPLSRKRPRPSVTEQAPTAIVVEPGLGEFMLSIVHLDTRHDWTLRHKLIAELAATVMERRLQWAIASGMTAFDESDIDIEAMGAGYTLSTLSISCTPAKWQLASDQFVALLQDSYWHGVSEDELDWACDALADEYWDISFPEDLEELSDLLIHQVDTGRRAFSPEQLSERVEDILDEVEVSEVNAALRDLLHSASSTLRIVTPHELPGLDATGLYERIADPQHVLNIVDFYQLMANERVEDWLDKVDWRGEVSSELKDYSSHHKLHSSKAPIQIQVSFALDDTWPAAQLQSAAAMLESYVQSAEPAIDELDVLIDVDVLADELVLTLIVEKKQQTAGLKLLRHILKHAEVDPLRFAAWQEREVKAAEDSESYDLEFISFKLLLDGLSHGAPLPGVPASASELADVSAADCNACLRDLLEHAPLTIQAEGPTKKKSMLRKLAKTFNGLLDRRDYSESPALELSVLADASKDVIMGYYDERAALLLAYPLPDASSITEIVATEIIDAYLTDAIRFNNPWVYSILVEELSLGDRRMLTVWTHCSADNIDRVSDAAQAALDKLATLGPSKAEIDAACCNTGLPGELGPKSIRALIDAILNTEEPAVIKIRTIADSQPLAA